MTFGLRWLVERWMTGRSAVGMGRDSADRGGERRICRFCSGEETSRGAEEGCAEGCEDKALAAVTRGCLRLRERSRVALRSGRSCEVERLLYGGVDVDLGAGLGTISHWGSWLSTWAFHAFVSAGVVRPTTTVMDSLSDSKLRIEVGVRADCCGFRLGDSLYWRVTLVEGGLVLPSSAALKV